MGERARAMCWLGPQWHSRHRWSSAPSAINSTRCYADISRPPPYAACCRSHLVCGVVEEARVDLRLLVLETAQCQRDTTPGMPHSRARSIQSDDPSTWQTRIHCRPGTGQRLSGDGLAQVVLSTWRTRLYIGSWLCAPSLSRDQLEPPPPLPRSLRLPDPAVGALPFPGDAAAIR